jgi:hypothetical protein
MRRATLLASTLALLLAGSATFAIAQDAGDPSHTTTASQAMSHPMPHGDHRPGGDRQSQRHRHGMRGGRLHGADMGAFSDLHALERLYQQAGRSRELSPVYNDVLARSQNPMLRTYVYHRLAQLQAQPANVDQAIGTLRKSLDENLANEAKRRAEHEQMRSQWQQRRAAAASTASANG